jgi:Ulp1 family protease
MLVLHQIHPVQSNGYDCGVWVLSHIASILRGYHTNAITERFIGKMRLFLLTMACHLPVLVKR